MEEIDEILNGIEKAKAETKSEIKMIKSEIKIDNDKILEWLNTPITLNKQLCCLIYGQDGTGKSGLALSYPLPKSKKMVVLDMDGGCDVLIVKYHKNLLKNHQILCNNPIEIKKNIVDGKEITTIDYEMTINKVRAIADYLTKNYKNMNIDLLVIDGLSKLLKYSEYQMRIEKHMDASGDVAYRYWKRRNQIFMEILEICKKIPINLILIAHDDFIVIDNDENIAMVKRETNRLVWQKIRCIRTKNQDGIIYKAIIDKSKYNTSAEGREFEFLQVDKDGNYKWDAKPIYNLLVGGDGE